MSLKNIKQKRNQDLLWLKILGNKNKPSNQERLNFKALEKGTFYARDLVSEPGNVLHPR